MREIILHFPTCKKDGEYAGWAIDDAAAYLTNVAGGCTMTGATGNWRDSEGKRVAEGVFRCYVAVANDGMGVEIIAWFKRFLREILEQDAAYWIDTKGNAIVEDL